MNTVRILTLIGAIFIATLCGCKTNPGETGFSSGKGEVGSFIVSKATELGAAPASGKALPATTTAWRYATDKHGVIIRLSAKENTEVEAFLREAFGKPGFGPKVNLEGGIMEEYRLTPTGGGIQFSYDATGTQVMILKALVPK